jgi:hypothetical protein
MLAYLGAKRVHASVIRKLMGRHQKRASRSTPGLASHWTRVINTPVLVPG